MTTPLPQQWDRTIIRGTDHRWTIRRVSESGIPVIPQAAKAQVRAYYGGPVWVEAEIVIDTVDGWVSVIIPHELTEAPEWDHRIEAIWDLEVDASGERLRWVQGDIIVSQDVTRVTA